MSINTDSETAVILVVDDDESDLEITRRWFCDANIQNDLYTVGGGEQALDYLFRRGDYSDPASSPRPDLILLDLNMPKVNGQEVLAQVRADEHLRSIPIVVMTSSNEELDMVQSYGLGANSYAVKPIDFEQLSSLLGALEHCWFQVVDTSPHSEEKTGVILVVDDDEADQELTRRWFRKAKIRNDLRIVDGGEQALDYLFRRGDYSDPESSPRPDLILLDLNMPKVDGSEVLARVRASESFKSIPIIVMTTSNQEFDMVRSFGVGASAYAVKPIDFDQLASLLSSLENFSLQIVDSANPS